MDYSISTLCIKRGAIDEEKIATLNYDLDLVRTKWHEMRLSFVPKFYVLHEHGPNLLLELSGFYGMGDDAT